MVLGRSIAAGALAVLAGCLEAPPDTRPPEDRSDAAGDVGDAGGGADAAVCPAVEAPGGQCGDDCTNACVGGLCTVDCTAGPGCHEEVICAPDFDCEVNCGVADVCIGAIVDCPLTHGCRVDCGGDDSCMNMVVNCAGGPCLVTCSGDPQSCREMTVNCGSGPCSAECPVAQTAPPALNCDFSCACDGC